MYRTFTVTFMADGESGVPPSKTCSNTYGWIIGCGVGTPHHYLVSGHVASGQEASVSLDRPCGTPYSLPDDITNPELTLEHFQTGLKTQPMSSSHMYPVEPLDRDPSNLVEGLNEQMGSYIRHLPFESKVRTCSVSSGIPICNSHWQRRISKLEVTRLRFSFRAYFL